MLSIIVFIPTDLPEPVVPGINRCVIRSKLAKTLFDFTEKNEIEFNITKGFIDNQIVDESTLLKLSKLPTKEVLLAKIMGSMNSPITNLVFVLNGTVQALTTVLQRYVEKAEEPKAEEPKAEEPK